MGTGTFADTGVVTPGDVATIATSAFVLTGVLLAGTTAVLDRRDVRT